MGEHEQDTDSSKKLDEFEQKIQELTLMLRSPVLAKRLWDRVLTTAEREELCEGDLQNAVKTYGGTTGLFVQARNVPWDLALIDAAYELELISRQEWKQLDRELTERFKSLSRYRTGPVADVSRLPMEIDEKIWVAAERATLLLIEGIGIRAMFWKGIGVDVNWFKHDVPWGLLLGLATQHRKGSAVDAATLGMSENKSDSWLKQTFHHLKKVLEQVDQDDCDPRELLNAVEARSSSGYVLTLPRGAAKVLHVDVEAGTVELVSRDARATKSEFMSLLKELASRVQPGDTAE